MANPKFIGEEPMILSEVDRVIKAVSKRDTEPNFRTIKTREFIENFSENISSAKDSEELVKKLERLNLTRLKSEHIMKLVDFKPKTQDDLKVVLQAYPLSLPKKDQESIIGVFE